VVFMEVRAMTFKLALLKVGDFTVDFVGHLGVISRFSKFGTVACVAGEG